MIQNIFDYPPYPYLEQIVNHCPKAAALYLVLWKNRDKSNKLSVYKKDIQMEYLTSPVKFRNDLLQLCKEALISIDETPNVIHLELVDWQDEMEQHYLC